VSTPSQGDSTVLVFLTVERLYWNVKLYWLELETRTQHSYLVYCYFFFQWSVFRWRPCSHIHVPKQWNCGHVGIPNQSCGSLNNSFCSNNFSWLLSVSENEFFGISDDDIVAAELESGSETVINLLIWRMWGRGLSLKSQDECPVTQQADFSS